MTLRVSYRDEYDALFGKGTGPLILARTDSLVTDGFGMCCDINLCCLLISYMNDYLNF